MNNDFQLREKKTKQKKQATGRNDFTVEIDFSKL